MIENTEKLQQIKDLLLKMRNVEKSQMQEDAIKEDGYFDIQSYCGGNFDDCYYMGKEVGEAKLIERILALLE